MKIKILSWNVDKDYNTTNLPEEVIIPDIIGKKPKDIENEILCIVGVPVREYVIKSKTEYWIFDDKCKEHGHCPCCGYGSVDLVNGEPHNYCPNCGTRLTIELQTTK